MTPIPNAAGFCRSVVKSRRAARAWDGVCYVGFDALTARAGASTSQLARQIGAKRFALPNKDQ